MIGTLNYRYARAGNVFQYNNIYANSDDGMENDLATTVDATYNWGGHPKGPGWNNPSGIVVNNGVNGHIDTTNWLKKPMKTAP